MKMKWSVVIFICTEEEIFFFFNDMVLTRVEKESQNDTSIKQNLTVNSDFARSQIRENASRLICIHLCCPE